MQIRTSEASWEGPLKEGKGRFWTESGEVSGVFSFPHPDSRTSPDES